MTSSSWFWAFNAGVLALLSIDLLVLRIKPRPVTAAGAALSSLAWIGLAAGFNAVLWHRLGAVKGMEFLAGYLVDWDALSVDNLFVFVVIFSYFHVEPRHQHRILFWGILGALVTRGIMIAAGVKLVSQFSWVLYLFGIFLLVTGLKLAFGGDTVADPETNFVLRLCRRWIPVAQDYQGPRFLVRRNGALMATPLLLALVVIELMDVVFAVDSIPAVFGITRDPFIVYSSNICAILGLRSMYFLLARVVDRFAYLKYGLAAVLCFVGVKMLISGVWEIPIGLSLGIVGGCLVVSVLASLTRR